MHVKRRNFLAITTTATISITGCTAGDKHQPEASGGIRDYDWELLEKRPNAIPPQDRETDTVVYQVEENTESPRLRINGLIVAGSSSCRHIDLQELVVQGETLEFTIVADYEELPHKIPIIDIGCTQDIFWKYYELNVNFSETLPKSIKVTHLEEGPPDGSSPRLRPLYEEMISI